MTRSSTSAARASRVLALMLQPCNSTYIVYLQSRSFALHAIPASVQVKGLIQVSSIHTVPGGCPQGKSCTPNQVIQLLRWMHRIGFLAHEAL